jgi:penicillin amidase
MVTAVEKALKPLPVPQFIGSNSWVIAPQKTATGKVLFANGPHIAFAQPSVWYEAHVHTPTYEMYGYHLAGIPFPILGHNRNIAYGMTMFQNDDLDFYWEENNPANAAQYKTATGYKDYEVVTKTIKVKDGDDVEVTVKRSQHGPIVNGIADGVDFEKSVAMSWIYTQRKNELLESCYIMSHAKNKEEFEQCLPKIHAPGLNIMYGDVDDNIGWYASAQLVEYPSHVNTKLILDGASGKDEIVRDLKTSENPRATNPPWNYVYSANNQPDSINGGFYPGYYLPENRGKRIVELIEANNQWSKEDMMEMLLDVTSKVHVEAIQEVLKTLEGSPLTEREKEAIEILKNWNGDNQVTDIAPTIYHGFIYQYIKNTFADELDEAGFEMFLKTHVFKRLEVPLLYKESIWYDDVNTTGTETRVFILQKSFKETIEKLESRFGANINDWTWNKVHTLEHQHPIGKIEMLRSYFNVGPFEIAGTREVINNLGYLYDESGNYDVLFGPSTRRVVDFSDVENSMSILPTGQSGNPFSEHYDDQAEMYVQGKFRKMMMNTEEIKKTAKNVLTLE